MIHVYFIYLNDIQQANAQTTEYQVELKKKGRNLFWRGRKRDFERKERKIWRESTHFPTPVRLPGPSHHPQDHRSEC